MGSSTAPYILKQSLLFYSDKLGFSKLSEKLVFNLLKGEYPVSEGCCDEMKESFLL